MLIDDFRLCELTMTCFLSICSSFALSRISSGPASYDNEEKTRFSYVLDHQPMSRRGYSFNARTEKRRVFVPKVIDSDRRVCLCVCGLDHLAFSAIKLRSILCFVHANRLTYQVRIRIKWI